MTRPPEVTEALEVAERSASLLFGRMPKAAALGALSTITEYLEGLERERDDEDDTAPSRLEFHVREAVNTGSGSHLDAALDIVSEVERRGRALRFRVAELEGALRTIAQASDAPKHGDRLAHAYADFRAIASRALTQPDKDSDR